MQKQKNFKRTFESKVKAKISINNQNSKTMVQKKFQKTIERCIRKAEQYNERLQKYIDTTGDDELPDIDCTWIGFSKAKPYTWERTDDGVVF